MAEFLLSCKCGNYKMYQKYISGVPNRKHWIIRCNMCNAYVETRKREKAIEMWNNWDLFHKNKIHSGYKEGELVYE